MLIEAAGRKMSSNQLHIRPCQPAPFCMLIPLLPTPPSLPVCLPACLPGDKSALDLSRLDLNISLVAAHTPALAACVSTSVGTSHPSSSLPLSPSSSPL